MSEDTKRYDDIINLPHPISRRHPPMSIYNRAAQFAPFAALTGHGAAINETARLTGEKIELSDEEKLCINEKLSIISEDLDDETEVAITYFVEDKMKSGGEYITKIGVVKLIDEYERHVMMMDRIKIPIDDILEIQGEIFRGIY